MRLIINTISWGVFLLCFGINAENNTVTKKKKHKEIKVTKIAYKSVSRKHRIMERL